MQSVAYVGVSTASKAVAHPDADDFFLATIGCSMLGISVDQASQRILPGRNYERVRIGIASGAQAIIIDDCKLILAGGCIVTVQIAVMSFCRPARRRRNRCYREISFARTEASHSRFVTDVYQKQEPACAA